MSDSTERKRYEDIPSQREAIDLEKQILEYWEKHDIFRRSIEERPEEKPFVFYEGPPTATGRPGVH
ncbi:MAG TPA: class I tRNA ligase family protein, partial [Candidatus Krumholzibacterium sp.]|nr:class I tRNA ligase family protein [Candidatus Krumholzibacterium sp.]